MGKNKLERFAEIATYSHVFQPECDEAREVNFELKGSWAQSFFKNSNPIVVELGCGKGEYTVELAKLFPEKNFIGIDIKGARLHRGATDSLELGLKNVAFLRTKIEFILSFFAENEVSEIWLTFPDPQMKKVNKRLTSTRFMDMYRRFLTPDGVVHLKTDSNFMFTYTEEMVKSNNLNVEVNTRDLYHSDIVSSILSIQTYYESQFMSKGIPIKYIRFKLNNNSTWIEPDVEIEPDPYRSFGRNARGEKRD